MFVLRLTQRCTHSGLLNVIWFIFSNKPLSKWYKFQCDFRSNYQNKYVFTESVCEMLTQEHTYESTACRFFHLCARQFPFLVCSSPKNAITVTSRIVLWHFEGKCWSSQPTKRSRLTIKVSAQWKALLLVKIHQNKGEKMTEKRILSWLKIENLPFPLEKV